MQPESLTEPQRAALAVMQLVTKVHPSPRNLSVKLGIE